MIIHKDGQLGCAKPKTVTGPNLLKRDGGGGWTESPRRLFCTLASLVFDFFFLIHPALLASLVAPYLPDLFPNSPWTVPGLQPFSPCPLQRLSLAGTLETDGAVTRETRPGSSKRDAGFRLGGMLAVVS